MLITLAQWLQSLSPEFGFLRVIQYLTFRAVMAAMTALLIGLAFGPWVIRRLAELKIGQPVREFDQQRIAAGVAERVVDGLEVVEVEQQHCHHLRGGAPVGQYLGQLARERGPVRDAGERIGLGHLERALALGRELAGTLFDALFEVGGERTQFKVGLVKFERLGFEQALRLAACAPFPLQAGLEPTHPVIDRGRLEFGGIHLTPGRR